MVQLRYLEGRFRMAVRKTLSTRDPKLRDRLKQLMTDPAIEAGQNSAHLYPRALAAHIQGMFLIEKGETSAAFELYQPIMQEWKTQDHLAVDQPEIFLHSFSSYLVSSWYGGIAPKELEGMLNFARQLPIAEPRLKVRVERISYQKELILQMNAGQFEAARTLIKVIEPWMESIANLLHDSNRLAFYYNFLTVNFFMDHYSDANRYVLQILNLPSGEDRVDIRSFARIFQLILQLELGELNLAEYLARSTQRHLQRNKLLMDFEKHLLKYIQTKLGTSNAPHSADQLEALADELNSILPPDWSHTPFLGAHEIRLWIESKLRKIPIREVFQEKQPGG